MQARKAATEAVVLDRALESIRFYSLCESIRIYPFSKKIGLSIH